MNCRYICYNCKTEHCTDNVVAFCASCYSSLRARALDLSGDREKITEKYRQLELENVALRKGLAASREEKSDFFLSKQIADIRRENAAMKTELDELMELMIIIASAHGWGPVIAQSHERK